jgi:hypothetical protein
VNDLKKFSITGEILARRRWYVNIALLPQKLKLSVDADDNILELNSGRFSKMLGKLTMKIDLSVMPKIDGRILGRGFNRVIDGLTWGLGNSAKILEANTREKCKISLPDSDSLFGVLGERLAYLGLTELNFEPMTDLYPMASKKGAMKFFRSLLYRPLRKLKTSSWVELIPVPLKDHESVRKELEGFDKPYAYQVTHLMALCEKFSLLDAEEISDTLAIFPRRFVRTSTRRHVVEDSALKPFGTSALVNSGWVGRDEGVEMEYVKYFAIGHLKYSRVVIRFIHKFLHNISGEKADEVMRLLKEKNPRLVNVLEGGESMERAEYLSHVAEETVSVEED